MSDAGVPRMFSETTNNTNTNTTQPNTGTDPNSTAKPPQTNTQPSLARRIQTSAKDAARTFVPQGPSSNAAQTLSNATNAKTGPSSSHASAGSSAQEILGSTSRPGPSERARGEAFRASGVGPDTNTSLRAQGGFELPALSAEEFERGAGSEHEHEHGYGHGQEPGIENSFSSAGPGSRDSREDLQSSTGNWKGKRRAWDPVQVEYTSAWERAQADTNAHSTTHANMNMNAADGAAVVSLLSDTSFDANFGGAYGDEDAYGAGVDLDPHAAPPPLTAGEIQMLESFRREIAREEGGVEGVAKSAQLSSFSLVPDIDAFLQENDPAAYARTAAVPSTEHTRSKGYASTPLRDAVLSKLPGAEDWVGVHERYHDEVWGYLRPALEAAKVEIEEKETAGDNGDRDGPAVQRLKMILRHMKA
ncbi:hypothetical protein N7466_003057 [Penicillium verhagenii]|uniref:uncharacterized protein n=1 Tax=Penicillium verhagenii TaxID=1562060 RepID=UPI0025451152|nr:uncharacterized protein N7466_003057 [Penicillium verhagenii]KAJ5936607.1 hypothetical protein N7466_003057 [Penicillium verhagenii]